MTDQSGGKTSGRSSDLSARLQAVAGLVTDGYRLADIGTDHAYIPIWLVKTGRIPGAVAADINKGPLKRAMEHIRANGLESRIDIRLSDGFAALTPGEVQSAVLAGMGGGLMIRILKEGIRVVECLDEGKDAGQRKNRTGKAEKGLGKGAETNLDGSGDKIWKASAGGAESCSA